jgi:hypothetical protein
MHRFITIEDVREDVMDRTADDHLVLPDVQFTDADIEYAMRKACRRFSGLKPYSTAFDPDMIPLSSNFMFDGIAWALLSRWLTNVRMNDEDYQAGGVTAHVQGSLVKNLEKAAKEYEERFVSEGSDYKLILNINNGFGPIG